MVKRHKGVAGWLAWLIMAVLFTMALPTPVMAAGQVRWSELSPDEQKTLEPLRQQWDAIDGDRQRKWRVSAKQYGKMKPEQQTRFQTNMREWARLTPQERAKARENFKQLKQLPPDQKQVAKERIRERHGQADFGPVPPKTKAMAQTPSQEAPGK
jgi:Protein of unknown function (DUF3106)